MDFKRCFNPACMLDVKYLCKCNFPGTYSCEEHIEKHLKLRNKPHDLESIFVDPSEETEDVTLNSLAEKKLNRQLKGSILGKRKITQIERDQKKVRSLKTFKESNIKNSQIANINEVLTDKAKNAKNKSNIEEKSVKIISKPINSENDSSFLNLPLMQTYQDCQDYANIDIQDRFLYNITHENNGPKLYIYNIKNKTKKINIIDSPEPLDWATSIGLLPNNKLFCFGNSNASGITAIIDKNSIEVLPSGTPSRCSSCIFFKNNVYCFGREDSHNCKGLNFSWKFDLSLYRWVPLASMPKHDFTCYCVIFNGNILISGFFNKRILIYSIDVDSFSTIPFKFTSASMKTIIKGEKLYLIEMRDNCIYESEIGNEYSWTWTSKLTLGYPSQIYCLCNNETIFIGCLNRNRPEYFKFDLNKKVLTKIG